jgi:hypothetical protein
MNRWLNWLGALIIVGDFVWVIVFPPELTIGSVAAILLLALLGITLVAWD